MEKLKLLIVEDDADQRELIRETLEDHFGRETVTAVGTQAEALAQEIETFDLVLSDFNLPDGTGFELLHTIRNRCTTPVIMVTGENVGETAAEAIRKGATDYVVKLGDYLFSIPLIVEKNLTLAKLMRENETLRMELEQALLEVRDKNIQLEASLHCLKELAATDPLTGLHNRRYFGQVLEQMFAEANRYQQELACVMIDLDSYKQLNDTYGHQVGDQLLMLAGKVISANMRKMDVAARYGGDEFVLLLPRATAEEAAQVIQRIRDEYRRASAQILGRTEGVSMSVGIASIQNEGIASADQLIAGADRALYRAKCAGRDRIVGAELVGLGDDSRLSPQPLHN